MLCSGMLHLFLLMDKSMRFSNIFFRLLSFESAIIIFNTSMRPFMKKRDIPVFCTFYEHVRFSEDERINVILDIQVRQ